MKALADAVYVVDDDASTPGYCETPIAFLYKT